MDKVKIFRVGSFRAKCCSDFWRVKSHSFLLNENPAGVFYATGSAANKQYIRIIQTHLPRRTVPIYAVHEGRKTLLRQARAILKSETV